MALSSGHNTVANSAPTKALSSGYEFPSATVVGPPPMVTPPPTSALSSGYEFTATVFNDFPRLELGDPNAVSPPEQKIPFGEFKPTGTGGHGISPGTKPREGKGFGAEVQ